MRALVAIVTLGTLRVIFTLSVILHQVRGGPVAGRVGLGMHGQLDIQCDDKEGCVENLQRIDNVGRKRPTILQTWRHEGSPHRPHC